MDLWQIIDVFGKDPDTKVVCEGCAKAFQYLCERSGFQSKDAVCCTASGTMRFGTGEGGRMRNVVTLGGKNFCLVDVTNCDELCRKSGSAVYESACGRQRCGERLHCFRGKIFI